MRIYYNQTPLKVPPRSKVAPLWAYLLLHSNQQVPRAHLAFTLWPDEPEKVARANLRRHLHLLRSILPTVPSLQPWLRMEGESLQWVQDDRCWMDVAEFEQLACSPDRLEEAVSLYTGDLLENLYEDWLFFEQERLKTNYFNALFQLIEQHRQKRNYPQAIQFANQLLARDPLREDGFRLLMSLCYASGDRAGALKAYDQFTERLRRELGVEPMPETLALYELVQRNAPLPAHLDHTKTSASIDTVTSAREPGGLSLPFFGRETEISQLRTWWGRASRGQGGLLLLGGEAGVGKTRLVSELSALVEVQGGRVLSGGTAYGEPLPFQAVVEALRMAMPFLSPLALASEIDFALAQLLPEWSAHAKGHPKRITYERPAPGLLGSASLEEEKARLFNALVEIFVILSKPRPILLVLEDLHWAGMATMSSLEHLAPQLGRYPILVLGTYREEEATRNHPLRSLRRHLQRKNQLVHLALGRLGEVAIQSILEHLSGSETTAKSLTQRLWTESEGNPLFVRERLRDLFESGQIQVIAGEWQVSLSAGTDIPGGVRATIAGRLKRLSNEAYQLAETAAVIGTAFDVELLREASGISEYQLFQGLDELLDVQLVREVTGRRGYDYRFSHHLIQETIYAGADTLRLRRNHRRIGRVMEEIYPERRDELASEMAMHFDRGGEISRAIQYYLRFAQQATSLYAYEEALVALARGLALASPEEKWLAERLALLRQRQAILGSLMRLSEWQADVEEIEKIANLLEDGAAILEALEARLWLYGFQSNWGRLVETGQSALGIAREVNNQLAEARIARTLGKQMVTHMGHTRDAIPILQRAVELTEASGNLSELVDLLCALAYAQRMNLNVAPAKENAIRALSIIDRYPELKDFRTTAMAELGCSYWFLAEWEPAINTIRKALHLELEASHYLKAMEVGINFLMMCKQIGLALEIRNLLDTFLAFFHYTGMPDGSDLVMVVNAIRGETYLMTGDIDEADRWIDETRQWREGSQTGRLALGVFESLGYLRLAQGRPIEAWEAFAEIFRRWEGDLNSILTILYWQAIAAQRAGDDPTARETLQRAEEIFEQGDALRFEVLRRYARYLIYGDIQELRSAHEQIHRQAELIREDEIRSGFFRFVPLHREVESCWQALQV